MSITPRKEYEIQLKDVQRNRDAVSGERKVKAERTKYLPPTPSMCAEEVETQNGYQTIIGHGLSSQGTLAYNKYLSLAYFYGATGRTVDGLTGLIFRKKPIIELPPNLEYLWDNCDGRGNSLRKQAQKVCEDAFITPRQALLVDYPQVGQHLSVAEAETNNLRPKILFYPFESILSWHYEVVDNEMRLAFVVLREDNEVREGFEIKTVTQYRVLMLIDGKYHIAMYDDTGELIDDPVMVLVDGAPSSEIPLFMIEVGAEGKSVISDLVDANFNHYRFFADYAAKEHASAFPVFYETGAVDEERNMTIGPATKWSNPNADATFGVLQSSGDGGSMRTYLQDMETRMAALGAEMLKPRSAGVESAESKSLDKVAQDSTTGNVATNVSEAYQKAIEFCQRWLGGGEGDIVFELSTDYNPSIMSGQDLTALVGAFQSGAISHDTFYWNLLKGERADPEVTLEEEQAKIQGADLGLV